MHLKRFQFVNHRWVKSHKAVQFPHTDLQLSDFLAAVPRQTLLRHSELKAAASAAAVAAAAAETLISAPPTSVQENEDSDQEQQHSSTSNSDAGVMQHSKKRLSSPTHQTAKGAAAVAAVADDQRSESSRRLRLESTSLTATPVSDEDLHDFHQHLLLPGYDKLEIKYNLYAAVVSIFL